MSGPFLELARTPLREPGGDGLIELAYFPAFGHPGELADQYARLLWYWSPLAPHLGRISLALEFEPPSRLDLPWYLDPGLLERAGDLEGRVRLYRPGEGAAWERALARAGVVMLWDQGRARPGDAVLAGKKVWRVDRWRERGEGSHYLMCGQEANPRAREDLARSREAFAGLLAGLGRWDKVYLFGTGPSLEKVMDLEFGDGLTVACNSMVLNRPLMDKLAPRLICCADPVFHAGCSRYAGAFRSALVAGLRRRPAWLVVPFRDYHVYHRLLPPSLRARLVGVPLAHLGQVNLDLAERFAAQHAPNVLTLLLLPLAATLSRDQVLISGCDGRAPQGERYFWRHHRPSQLEDEMASVRRAHPAFFEIDYQDYYQEHCRLLEIWLQAGEARGLVFRNLTRSYIPALQKRSGPETL